jgi:hypothetical protein
MRGIRFAGLAVIFAVAPLAACSGGDLGAHALAGDSLVPVLPQMVARRPVSLRGSVVSCKTCTPEPSVIKFSKAMSTMRSSPTPSVPPPLQSASPSPRQR